MDEVGADGLSPPVCATTADGLEGVRLSVIPPAPTPTLPVRADFRVERSRREVRLGPLRDEKIMQAHSRHDKVVDTLWVHILRL